MSKDVLVNIDIIKEHPNRINKLIDRVVEEIEALRAEGYELYTITMKKQQECNNQMQDISNQYHQEKQEYSPAGIYYDHRNIEDPLKRRAGQDYRDAQEQDFYDSGLKSQYSQLENRMGRLNQSKETLDNIAQQVSNISKTTDDLRVLCEKWNKIYTVTVNGLIDLNK